jgi:primosomal protein N' (replication factor Y)
MKLFDSSNEYIISVAVPRPLPGLFTYRIPSEMLPNAKVGGWVRVPFGHSNTHAYIVEPPQRLQDAPHLVEGISLKSVLEVSDPSTRIPEDVISLCRWAHEYYFSSFGDILNCATSIQTQKKQTRARKKKKNSFENHAVDSLVLTSHQMNAIQELELLRAPGGQVALLEGVTGSGKTEVYIELAKKTLSLGKGVIILVPEIALSPQLHQRFENGLRTSVGLWHSAVSKGVRHEQCAALLKGELKVIVGARSAVFAPVSDLGLIVIDEEHDSTYKQEDRVRYHARDLAVVRGKLTKSLVVLGSATPSFETRERVREGKYSHVKLSQRIAPGGMPAIEIVDLSSEPVVENFQAPLAEKTIQSIRDVLQAGEQAIVYLNRRGFAAFLLCKDCGEVSECPNCSISLTVHQIRSELKCHTCGYRQHIPDFCKKCQGVNLIGMGAGTESLEAQLPTLIPEARISRLDRDQVTSATRLESILNEFREGKTNLLLGTQMLVKGHDFPGVTLVVVVLADALFRWPDFRAPERAFQILKQVSGRAGRGEKAGRVMIQTFSPTHPVLQVILGQVPESDFFDSERQLREVLGYPPLGRLARLRVETASRADAVQRTKAVLEYIQKRMMTELNPQQPGTRTLELLGPSEAFLEKAKGIYRWDILIKSKTIRDLQKSVAYGKDFCIRNKWTLLVDIDPYGI